MYFIRGCHIQTLTNDQELHRPLVEHGTSLLFGAVVLSCAFFSAAISSLPVLRQFYLQVRLTECNFRTGHHF
ncbi:unnamed protein product [Protopolystoma xenopodis]|uniref:Uncharacterized protein n=1 Tax=Protopolystoma xenopodis TaxID=117903 RepID=A0A448XK06_9PLAT|nr:unnamed protein product [Protopolystoma xenopodis]